MEKICGKGEFCCLGYDAVVLVNTINYLLADHLCTLACLHHPGHLVHQSINQSVGLLGNGSQVAK